MSPKRQPSSSPAIPSLPGPERDLVLALRAWFHLRRRVLPWREEPTPYRVWISEIMLQQTQVDTVIPYFERFIERFPDVQSLAAAPLDDVLSLWSGLGYYRRARFLHAAAAHIVAHHRGELPSTVPELLGIPGIGRYTAGAIASIAFGKAAPLVDGNVQRVLARLVGLTDTVDGTAGTKALWALATTLVPSDDPSSHNQGLMELGALVCTPTRPDCGTCPWGDVCRAKTSGNPEAFPKKEARRAPRTVHALAGVLRPNAGSDALLFARSPDTGLLAGLWGLPMHPVAERDDPTPPEPPEQGDVVGLATAVATALGRSVAPGAVIGRVFHQFTHRSLHLDLIELALTTPCDGAALPDPGLRWLKPAEAADAVPLSTLTRKVLKAAAARTSSDVQPSRKPVRQAARQLDLLISSERPTPPRGRGKKLPPKGQS